MQAETSKDLIREGPLTLHVGGECMRFAMPHGAKTRVEKRNLCWPGDIVAYGGVTAGWPVIGRWAFCLGVTAGKGFVLRRAESYRAGILCLPHLTWRRDGCTARGKQLMTANKQVWKVDPSVRFRRLFDEAVLIHQAKAEALVLNDTAISFIEGCDGERTVEQVIAGMVEEFDVSAEQLAEDLRPFIEELAAQGIIEAV